MKKQLAFVLFAATALSASAASSVHSGLLNYWGLDFNTNDTAGFFAGSTGTTNNNATVNGTVPLVPGFIGTAASFDGLDANTITVADGGASTLGGVANDIDRTGSDVTISVWVKATSWDQGWQGIVAHGEGNDYRIARRGGDNPVKVAYAGGSNDIFTTSTYGAAPAGDGLWHHIVAITENGGATQLWVDGIFEASNPAAASIAQSGANNNTLCIGCNPDAAGRGFKGLIDEVAMWDRPLTASEIGFIYNGGKAGLPLSAIPEPGTALLGLLGALGLLRRRR